MNNEEFEKLVKVALDSLPQEFQDKLENVDVFVQDWPHEHQVQNLSKKGYKRGLIFGLYEGIPQTKRGNRYGVGATLPDRITIFKIPLLKISKTYDELFENIKDTVIHEVAHHFGMSEKAISDANRDKKR